MKEKKYLQEIVFLFFYSAYESSTVKEFFGEKEPKFGVWPTCGDDCGYGQYTVMHFHTFNDTFLIERSIKTANSFPVYDAKFFYCSPLQIRSQLKFTTT